MTELSTKKRNKLPRSSFAYVDHEGAEHLPIHDEEHVRNAMARFGQTHFENASDKKKAAQKIVRAAKKHGVEIGEDDDVRAAA